MARQPHVNPIHPLNLNLTDNTYKFDNTDNNRFEVIGICYVPIQQWEQIYDEDTAFAAGTLFPELNLPFLGGGR